MELILTLGLVSVILGTASGAQNVGLFGVCFAVAAAVHLALEQGTLFTQSQDPKRNP